MPRSTSPLRRLLGRASLSKLLTYCAVGLVVVVAVAVLGREIERHLSAIESWIAGLGPLGVAAFVLLFIVTTSLLIPDTVLCIVAGALFSLAWGTAAVLTGAILAAALQYAVAQGLLRARIEQALAARPSLSAIQRAVRGDELRLQLLLRLTPLSPAMMSYVLGAAGVSFRAFLLGCAGLVPGLFIEVYLGHAGRHIARLAGQPAPDVRLQDALLGGGLLVGVAVVIFVSRLARKTIMEEVARSEIS